MAANSQRRGFTLVELLVVIGIIALLISILLPSLAAARQAAQTVQCASNLRQIGIAIHMYADQFQGWVPAETTKGAPYHWMGLLHQNTGLGPAKLPTQNVGLSPVGVWACPNSPGTVTSGTFSNYGMNQYAFGNQNSAITSTERVRKLAQFKRPSEILAVADSTVGFTATTVGQSRRVLSIFAPPDWGIYTLHNNNKVANMLFADGHVETGTPFSFPPDKQLLPWWQL